MGADAGIAGAATGTETFSAKLVEDKQMNSASDK
jgi:hypothetical protein